MARVLLFGPLADQAGWRERDIAADTLNALVEQISQTDPALGTSLIGPGVQVALNQAITRDFSAWLSPTSEVAFLPPMSGG